MDLNDLWVGDRIRNLKNNKIGTFVGISENELVQVKFENRIEALPISQLTLVDEPEFEVKKINLEEEKFEDPNKSLYFDSTIDLHIEILKPELQHARAEQILNYQLRAAKFYVEKAIFLRKHSITIIHGKGVGLLKLEINQLLQSFEEVQHIIEVNKGGAVEVYFNYI